MRLNNWLIAGLLGLILSFGWVASCVRLDASQDALRVAEEVVEEHEAVNEISAEVGVKRAEAGAKIAREAEKQQEAYDEAIADSPDWANERIPADILASLRDD
jgi:hypothetical protein